MTQVEVGSAGAPETGGETTSVADQSAGLLHNWRDGPPRYRAGGSGIGTPEGHDPLVQCPSTAMPDAGDARRQVAAKLITVNPGSHGPLLNFLPYFFGK
eukprot:3803717-Pyramimonas_sp.AAC.1